MDFYCTNILFVDLSKDLDIIHCSDLQLTCRLEQTFSF